MNQVKYYLYRVVLLTALLAIGYDAVAQEYSANDVTIEAGGKATLVINLTHAENYTSATIDLQLPKGISIAQVKNSDNEMVPDVTSERTKSKHAISVHLDAVNNIYRIMTYASNNATFKTNGAFFIIGLEASASAVSGTGKIIADGGANGTKTQVLVAPDGSQTFAKDITFDIYVKGSESPKTYNLSIKATGNGSASYDGNTIRSKTSTFTVTEGTNVIITFTPDNGYQTKSVKVNNSAVSVSNNQYIVRDCRLILLV